jgi:hypothetical protein
VELRACERSGYRQLFQRDCSVVCHRMLGARGQRRLPDSPVPVTAS